MQNGLKLALWAYEDIAHDTGIVKAPHNPAEFTLGYNVNSTQMVDEMIQKAKAAGARIIRQPHKTFWGGYAGYFQDLDGHIWETVWNPDIKVEE